MGPDPTPVRDVGDRVVAGEVLDLLQPGLEHLEQPSRLAAVAIDGPRDRLGGVAREHVGLTHHRADAADLEEQPLQRDRARVGLGRQQPTGLVREVEQDRAALEHDEVLRVVVDDHRDAAVGVEREEPRLALLEPRQVDRAHRVGQRQLLERDGDLAAVGRGRGQQLDHAWVLSQRARAQVGNSWRYST
ncbi:MAG: hypothetical protein U0168_26290 [Nannocystaceae bacterium]